jgi:hypothetical protein
VRDDKVKARSRLFNRGASRAGNFAMMQPAKAIAKVSSTTLRTIGDVGTAARGKPNRDRERQGRAYEVVHDIGELGFIVNLKANLIARCDLVLQRQKEAATPEESEASIERNDWIESNDPRAVRVDNALVGPQGGQDELKRRSALHLSTAGEYHLLGTAAGDDGSIVWEVLSVLEMVVDATGTSYRKRDGFTREDIPKDNYTARCWRSDAAFSDLADSEVLRIIGLCNQIIALDQALEAVIRSKLAAQIMYVPYEISFAPDSEDEDGEPTDDADEIDPFTDELLRHMSEPIKDRSAAAALVPLVMRGPADMHDKVHMIDVARDLDTMYQDLRKEALERMFRSVDAPPEMISGKAGLSGLGGGNVAISIDADFVNKHCIPLGEMIADFFTVAYLRPMLETFEQMAPEESARYRYVFDPSKITSSGDEAANATKLHDADLLKDDSWVEALGYDTADKPDPEELVARRTWELVRTNPAIFAKALLPTVPGFENIDVSQLGAAPAPPAGGPPPPSATEGGPPALAPPGQYLPAAAAAEREMAFDLLARSLAVAADAAMERAVEQAGSRVVSMAGRHKDPTIKDRLKSVPKSRVLTVLSPVDLAAMHTSLVKLFDGAWDGVTIRMRSWIRNELIAAGVDSFDADDRAAHAASQLCAAMNALVLDHVHTGVKTGANGLRVPDALVAAALTPLLSVS